MVEAKKTPAEDIRIEGIVPYTKAAAIIGNHEGKNQLSHKACLSLSLYYTMRV